MGRRRALTPTSPSPRTRQRDGQDDAPGQDQRQDQAGRGTGSGSATGSRDRGRGRKATPATDAGAGGDAIEIATGRGGQPEEPFTGEPVEVAGLPRPARRGLRLPAPQGLPALEGRRVRVGQAGAAVRPAQGRLPQGRRADPAARNEKNPALLRIDSVNARIPSRRATGAGSRTSRRCSPTRSSRLELSDDPSNMTARIIDLISPIGKGQRGLIVSPPKAGKTTIMKQIARPIEVNNPEVHLIVLLVDERPEEVTDMKRWLLRGRGGRVHVRPSVGGAHASWPSSPSSGPSEWSRWARTS